jgi:CBS domain-containing protein
MLVSDVCKAPVVEVSAQASIEQAAHLMELHGIGSLVVVDANELPIGLVTDRDLAVKGIPRGVSINQVLISEVMSSDPIFTSQNTRIEEALQLMRKFRIRRLIVTDEDGKVCGILSADDCFQMVVNQIVSLRDIYSAPEGKNGTHFLPDFTRMA